MRRLCPSNLTKLEPKLEGTFKRGTCDTMRGFFFSVGCVFWFGAPPTIKEDRGRGEIRFSNLAVSQNGSNLEKK